MAENSKRERIIQNVVDSLRTLPWVKTLTREQAGDPGDLDAYAQTQFPVLATVGQLPQPREERRCGRAKEFLSDLDVELYLYALNAATPDAGISSMLDDIWAAIFADRTRGGLAMDTSVLSDVAKAVYPPYVAVALIVRVTYIHDSTGI